MATFPGPEQAARSEINWLFQPLINPSRSGARGTDPREKRLWETYEKLPGCWWWGYRIGLRMWQILLKNNIASGSTWSRIFLGN